ncbi:2-dehydro-3-deoxy-6-phosphogalactonate aldolase [Sphingomonas sinipercae]|uniref:2-dehydro-3-deoxy-6-phosphogalactonate aldolase n=1 Tax=Sphingomonas sinipercae TaxID=2714944 RepID=A0A6G7ZLQ4_9SPHN|nr:2-dehydro-3-deoxy-6-phosphogalactonate aldolase [Sphingomonas sinipercae]QIL01849.1 2-dehydro-3-deoxy-6-phosphogalactonate aldolase [Sphingomonas sinipercae]
MNARAIFDRYFDECPLVAIIRGVTPDEADAIGDALFEAGIRIVEVPMNSPDPLRSIKRLAARLGERALVGAGTVLRPDDVQRVRDAGGRLVVSPNTNIAVIKATVAAGVVASPGFFTPSEAFAALENGAHALKLFPAEAASPAVVKAMRAVLPKDVPLLIVGGVTPDTVGGWMAAGADGFGLGGALYQAGQTPAATLKKGRAFVAAVQRCAR